MEQAKCLRPGILTARYAVLQGCYWFCYCGLFSFAAVLLFSKGYTASQTGVLLALSTLCSCLLQPAVATFADKESRASLPTILLLLCSVVLVCILGLLFLPLSPLVYAAVYLLGALLLDLSMPLVNALCAYFNNHNIPVNFGVGRGVGSLMFAGASAIFGFVADRFGAGALLYIVLAIVGVFLYIVLRFRAAAKRLQPVVSTRDQNTPQKRACTLPQFFRRYKLYCFSLIGIFFMAAFHGMTENYLIAIIKRLGGSNGDLGIALAIATVLEIPVIVFYSRFRRFATSRNWLLIASLGFLFKSVLFILAKNVTAILFIQVLQIVSYSLYAPTSVFYARESVDPSDTVKGQAMITSAYALGCSLGSFLGGRLLDYSGVPALLWVGVLFAAMSVIVLVISTRKQPAAPSPVG